jgi:hypothetical protein
MKKFNKSLTTYIVFTVLGVAGFLYAILFLPRDNYQQGLIYGITSGFILIGILGIIYSLYLMRNPKKAKEVDLQQNEERTQFIRMKTGSTTAFVMIYVESLATVILGLLGHMELSIAIAAILLVHFFLLLGLKIYFSKKY